LPALNPRHLDRSCAASSRSAVERPLYFDSLTPSSKPAPTAEIIHLKIIFLNFAVRNWLSSPDITQPKENKVLYIANEFVQFAKLEAVDQDTDRSTREDNRNPFQCNILPLTCLNAIF
jgi:hypothetical protein